MDQDDYQPSLQHVYRAALMLAQLPLQEMLDAINKSETYAPFMDPTLYREKGAAMADDKNTIRAAMALAKIGKEIREMPPALVESGV